MNLLKENIETIEKSGSVFVLQHKETMRIHGCFNTREKAENYANGSTNIAMMVADYGIQNFNKRINTNASDALRIRTK